MSYTKISQADARRYRNERDQAREKLRRLLQHGANAFFGQDIGSQIDTHALTMARLGTAKALGYAIFVTVGGDEGRLTFRAIKPSGE